MHSLYRFKKKLLRGEQREVDKADWKAPETQTSSLHNPKTVSKQVTQPSLWWMSYVSKHPLLFLPRLVLPKNNISLYPISTVITSSPKYNSTKNNTYFLINLLTEAKPYRLGTSGPF